MTVRPTSCPRLASLLRMSRSAPLIVVSLLATSAIAAEVPAQRQIEILSAAQRAYDRGVDLRLAKPSEAAAAFNEAAAGFAALVDAGVRNGKLCYNLANAYLQSGDVGRAILNYRRAERLLPRDPRIDANLRAARSLRRNDIPPSAERAFLQTFFFWHYKTSLRARYFAAIAFYVLFWLVLTLRIATRRRSLIYAVVPCLLIWVALASSVAIETGQHSRHREGVIVADDVVARKGNGESFEPQFDQKLYQGVEFNLLEGRGDWLHVQLPDAKSGWIRTRDAELI